MPIKLTLVEKKALNEFKKALTRDFSNNIMGIKLFGSKARGDTHSESDIDILLLVKDRPQAFEDYVIQLVCDILNEYGVYIETVTMTEKVYTEALQHQYPFVQNMEREAVSL